MPKLTLDDIADLRAYEREREEFRAHVIALKQKRRIPVGPVITFVFENRDTMRFQIQEMAHVERLFTDEQIETELRVYNPLIPEPGHLAATMFIELTSDEMLREWLPKLVGVEASVELWIGSGIDAVAPAAVPADGVDRVACIVDPDHAEQLTRDDTTASVHYVHLALTAEQVARLAAEPIALAVVHPSYVHHTVLGDDTRTELLQDLREGG